MYNILTVNQRITLRLFLLEVSNSRSVSVRPLTNENDLQNENLKVPGKDLA